jgi:NAD(P)H-nitrite reductase large subunit
LVVGIGPTERFTEPGKMIVCLCKGVSCGAIRNAIAEGNTTVDQIGRACGAGTDCGGCEGAIEDLVEQELGSAVTSCGRRALPVIRAA